MVHFVADVNLNVGYEENDLSCYAAAGFMSGSL